MSDKDQKYRPGPVELGGGAASGAARTISGRQRQIDRVVDAAVTGAAAGAAARKPDESRRRHPASTGASRRPAEPSSYAPRPTQEREFGTPIQEDRKSEAPKPRSTPRPKPRSEPKKPKEREFGAPIRKD